MEKAPDVSPEVPTVSWRLALNLLARLPQGAMSRAFGRIADLPIPRVLRRPVLGAFARSLGVRLQEVEHPLEHYPSLNAFFVRRLRPGSRSWPKEASAIASPVDGVIGRSGRILAGRALQAKGRGYSVGDLLSEAAAAERFLDGSFLTIYLSPRHYHRIHAPIGGTISRAYYVPGALLPVNAPSITHVQELFPRNERLICHIDGEVGTVAVVAIGAFNVGRISAAFDPDWADGYVTNRRNPPQTAREYTPPIVVARGQDLMAFHLGSTVVLLFEAGIELRGDLAPGREIRVGEEVAFGGRDAVIRPS